MPESVAILPQFLKPTDSPTFTGLTITGLTASQAVVTDSSKNLASLAYGSTGVASSLVQLDANSNLKANRYATGYATTVTAGGTTTLTAASAQVQIFTGSGVQTVIMPSATTLQVGDWFDIYFTTSNTSASQVRDGSNSTIATMNGPSFVRAICTNNGSTAGTWDVSFQGNATSVSNTAVMRNSTGGITVGLVTSGSQNITGNAIISGQMYCAGFGCSFTTLTYGATITPIFNAAQLYRLTLTGNVTTFANPTSPAIGNRGIIECSQDATGSRTLPALAANWGYLYTFPAGAPPVLTLTGCAKDFLDYYVDSYSSITTTVTIASPAVFTATTHNFCLGDKIQFTTTGALPTGLATATTYYVNPVTTSTYNVATSLVNLRAGTYVNTSGSQSGTHTGTGGSVMIKLGTANVA